MDRVSDVSDALARKLFVWTFIYALAFGVAVLLILKG